MMYEMALLKLSRFRPSRVVPRRLLSASLPHSEEKSRDEATEARAKPFSEMPGDHGWPLIGVVDLLRGFGDGSAGRESYYYKVHMKYGPIARLRSIRDRWVVLVSDPKGAEAMFRAEGKYPSRGEFFEQTITDIHKMNNWPSPLIFAHKEDWKRIRSAIGKQVIPRRVGNLTAPLCDITDDLMENLKETMDNNDGRIEDIMAKMTLWAFQNTAYFVFGENMNVFTTNDPTQKEFMSAGLEFVEQVSQLRPLPIYKYFPTKAYKRFIQATGRMRELGKQVMERKVVQLSEDIARGTVDETKAVGILEQWLIEGKLEPEDALTQACDLLSAGLDTTKNTTTFLLFELAKQPALQDQLCQDIKAVLGDKVNPSWEDLQNIPLVRHCLKETLRVYPAVPLNVRELPENAVICGYHVPAGTAVLATHGPSSASKDYFREVDKFIPERWSKDKESIHPFSSLPFGFGQRGCYGRRLAELEIYILLTKLIPRFTLCTDKDSIALYQSTVLRPNEPVTLTIKERERDQF